MTQRYVDLQSFEHHTWSFWESVQNAPCAIPFPTTHAMGPPAAGAGAATGSGTGLPSTPDATAATRDRDAVDSFILDECFL